MQGKLYLVPTPIGNLEDITFRAVSTLKRVDAILAEDTRTSRKLLQHYDVNTPMYAHHAHNEHTHTQGIIEQLLQGKTFAVISDAGTPGISDPGFYLLRACIEKEIPVEVLPGATAFVPALLLSGFPNHEFVFMGFLPQKKGRQTKLKQLAEEKRMMVFYESPHKIDTLLKQLQEHLGGEREVSISRELTKMYEETLRGSLNDLITQTENKSWKGELVVVVKGKK